jgi:hypothetical protein
MQGMQVRWHSTPFNRGQVTQDGGESLKREIERDTLKMEKCVMAFRLWYAPALEFSRRPSRSQVTMGTRISSAPTA